MRKIKKTAALLAIAAVVGSAALAGCSDSDSSEASTPADATTSANSALQTDSEGATVTAPPEETSAATTERATTEETTEGGDEEIGDVAAGKATFEGTCQGCHPAGGTQAGVGPQLAGAPGINEALIRNRIQNGIGAMPPGLVSGDDEDNVVAYVVSIQ